MRSAPLVSGLVVAVATLAAQPAERADRLTAATFAGLELRGIGPAVMSGRIADIAIDPTDRRTWYVAAGSGGVWRTTNAGVTFEPIFDRQSSYSIGCVAIDPQRPQTIWVGTGENVSGRHVGYGDGLYRSRDGGRTWDRVGLDRSEHISKILVDPRRSTVVYVAAEGPLWAAGGDRGVYKTTDGGATWTPVLRISDDTGIADLAFAPDDPDTLYAAAYQRRRTVWALLAGGPESGIHKSTDGGATWRRVATGLPAGHMGKIGLAVTPADPRLVYATIEADEKERGFYRSADRGESWEKRSDYLSDGTGPHYYQEIYASPHRADRIYQMDVSIHISDDGGRTFTRLGEAWKHSDNHALAFDPDDPDHLIAGTDGGVYETFDHAQSWRFVEHLPLTQVYKLSLDNAEPFYNVIGGTQDNGTQIGPIRTTHVNGIRNDDWTIAYGADGYACQFDPKDPTTAYLTWQNGHLLRYDRPTGELLEVTPQPGPEDPPERWNWDAPILVSPHSHTRLYFGSQRLWRSEDRGESWTPVSGDLSRGRNRYELPMRGRVQSVDALYGNTAMSWYGNLTSITESPSVEGLLYVGTDDGLVHVSQDGGRAWRRAGPMPGVPEGAFVNEIKASVIDADTVFVALDNHKTGDFAPYLLRSRDRGRTWSSIAGDLPARHLVWSVEQDHEKPDLLFAGTEFGLFFTLDGGAHWVKLTGGVPTIAFRDIEIQRRENDLVGASFGRGFYVLDDYSPLREVGRDTLSQAAVLFPVRDADWYVPAAPLAMRDKAMRGATYFTSPNPPFGAVFTYYLAEELKGLRAQRRDREKPLEAKGVDVPFPGWQALDAEGREAAPQIVMIVRDGEGRMVRRLTGPATAGFHRVAWDLREPPTEPVRVGTTRGLEPWESPPQGPLVPPGRYTVQLATLVDGTLTPVGQPRAFPVVPIRATPGYDAAAHAFALETSELQRKVLSTDAKAKEVESRLEHLEKALLSTPGAAPALIARGRDLSRRIADIRKALTGDPTLARFDEPSVPSIVERISTIVNGFWDTTRGPTVTHRQSLAVASGLLAQTTGQLTTLLSDLQRLEADAEAAGAPWTPGRALPGAVARP